MARRPYPSDVTDDEWAFAVSYLTLMDEDAPQREHSLREVLRRLDTAGVVPESVGLRKPTLDEVFLRLTGHGSTGPADRSAA